MPRNSAYQRWRQKWRRMPPWARLFVITGIIVGITGSVTGARSAWPILRLGLPATIYYVDDSLDEHEKKVNTAQQTTNSILRDLQIESTEGKRSNASNALANWKLERTKTQDPVSFGLIDQQIREKEDEINRLNNQLKTLNRLKGSPLGTP